MTDLEKVIEVFDMVGIDYAFKDLKTGFFLVFGEFLEYELEFDRNSKKFIDNY